MDNVNIMLYGAKENAQSIIYFFQVNELRIDTLIYPAGYDRVDNDGSLDYQALLKEACGYAALCYTGREL